MAVCNNCGDKFDDRRLNLGYPTCLPCGDKAAHSVRWLSAPLSKSSYVLISNLEDLKGLNPKRLGE